MKQFIYVFSTEDRDKLLGLGFSLLKEDEDNNIFVFVAENVYDKSDIALKFDAVDLSEYMESDTLTF